jgi:hypothetical protein
MFGATTKIWQIISAILTTASISFAVYTHFDKEKIKKMAEEKVKDMVEELVIAQLDIAKIELENNKLKKQNIEFEKNEKIASFKKDSLINEARKKDKLIAELNKRINDKKPVILNVDDNEQLRIFLEWSSTLRVPN